MRLPFVIGAVCLVLCTGYAAAQLSPQAKPQTAKAPEVAATVGGTAITVAQVVQESPNEKPDKYWQGNLRLRIFKELVRQYAARHKIECTPADLAAKTKEVARIAAENHNEFKPDEEWTEWAKFVILAEKIRNQARTRKKIDAAIAAHPEYFNGTTVSIQYITIACDALSPTSGQKQAQAKLEKIRRNILAGKMTFEQAAALPEISKKLSGKMDGADYWTVLASGPQQQMGILGLPTNLAAAAFATKVGELSAVVQSGCGFHLVKVVSHKSGTDAFTRLDAENVLNTSLKDQVLTDVIHQGMGASPIEVRLPHPPADVKLKPPTPSPTAARTAK